MHCIQINEITLPWILTIVRSQLRALKQTNEEKYSCRIRRNSWIGEAGPSREADTHQKCLLRLLESASDSPHQFNQPYIKFILARRFVHPRLQSVI